LHHCDIEERLTVGLCNRSAASCLVTDPVLIGSGIVGVVEVHDGEHGVLRVGSTTGADRWIALWVHQKSVGVCAADSNHHLYVARSCSNSSDIEGLKRCSSVALWATAIDFTKESRKARSPTLGVVSAEVERLDCSS